MSEGVSKKPFVVHGNASLNEQTAQTLGIQRRAALDKQTVGAERVWLGIGVAEANKKSLNHHHGEAETCTYVLSGRFRVHFGEDYEEFVEVGPGDFLYVPAHIHHYEINEYDEDGIALVFRSPDNIVVNLE